MASVTRNQVSKHIPHDIAFDILFKLPLKSLKRFSCVCKFWENLFENTNFMTMFYKHNNFFPPESDDHLNSRLLLQQASWTFGYYDQSPWTIGYYDKYQYMYFLSGNMNSVKLDWPSTLYEHELIIFVGSVVNGIVCLLQGEGEGSATWIGQKVVLWNPSTDEFKDIPNGSIDHIIARSVFEDLAHIGTFVDIHGFGYDPVADDYKLIRFICICNDNEPELNDVRAWQIYSLRSNSWKDLNVRMPAYTLQYFRTGYAVHFNGMCHWLGVEEYSYRQVLVSFNLSDEVFITTPFAPNHVEYDKYLVVLNGFIAMIECPSESFHLNISILGEFGVAESWTKILTIGPLPDITRTIGIGKNGDIFYVKKGAEIIRFNLYTKKNEATGFKGHHDYSQIFIYTESLLPIGGIHS